MKFAERMNVTNFYASDGWLDRWKKRYNISFKMVSGEANACTSEMVAPGEETKLPTILSKYKLNQVYNSDEFGLFYRLQPNKSLHFKNEKFVGGKHIKLRLTGLASAMH
ncbi:tigger transposable element-derived protein 4-like [Hydra vulgaris]|uniref:tigger transposable element-derived protein 4-like n=1 Tax=Hydra vulgaris TaxID=6087 RepID=UPI001F5F2902|nr:tigger transposable element-derived protein 4-like [Hydra vulgaris]